MGRPRRRARRDPSSPADVATECVDYESGILRNHMKTTIAPPDDLFIYRGEAFSDVLGLRGRPLRPPREVALRPDPRFIEWHRREVFREEPRRRPRA